MLHSTSPVPSPLPDTADRPPIYGTHFAIPFHGALQPAPVIIIDTETEDQNITVLGYYRIGESHIHQIFFPTPISPRWLRQTEWFEQNFLDPTVRLAIYNVCFEAELFGLEKDRCLELQPLPYMAKEEYILLKSLTTTRHIPRWTDRTKAIIGFHNYSCIIKEIWLYLGRHDFCLANIQHIYSQEVRHHLQ